MNTNVRLPYLAAAQAQKHVTHYENLHALDAVVQLAFADRDLAGPPPAPADGARYIVAAGAMGAWSGQPGRIAGRSLGLLCARRGLARLGRRRRPCSGRRWRGVGRSDEWRPQRQHGAAGRRQYHGRRDEPTRRQVQLGPLLARRRDTGHRRHAPSAEQVRERQHGLPALPVGMVGTHRDGPLWRRRFARCPTPRSRRNPRRQRSSRPGSRAGISGSG